MDDPRSEHERMLADLGVLGDPAAIRAAREPLPAPGTERRPQLSEANARAGVRRAAGMTGPGGPLSPDAEQIAVDYLTATTTRDQFLARARTYAADTAAAQRRTQN